MKKAGKALNILWLWPDILNQHGDRGNVMALDRVCRLYGIEANITRVNRLTDSLRFKAADIVLLGAGELAVIPQVVGALSKRFSELKTWTEKGGVLLATGATCAALGVHTIRMDGSHVYGLGLLYMECREREAVLGDDLIFRIPGIGAFEDREWGSHPPPSWADGNAAFSTVTGIQIQMADITLASGQQPFGEVVYGYGNNGGKAEGAVRDGIVFTNALGPVLVKNPWLTLALIQKALKRKAPDMDPGELRFDPALFGLEMASATAIRSFNDTKERPK